MARTSRVEIEVAVGTTGDKELDRLLQTMRNAGQDVAPFEKAAQALGSELARLRQQQALIDQFGQLKRASSAAATALDDVQRNAQELGKTLAQTEAPTKKQISEFERARKAVGDAKQAYQDITRELDQTRSAMSEAGLQTQKLATQQAAMAKSAQEAQAALAANTDAARAAAAQHQQLAASTQAQATATQQKTNAIKQGLALEQSEIELQRQILALEKDHHQALLQSAKARGDEAAAMQSSNRLAAIEAEQLQLVARGKRAEAAAVDATTAARRQELAAVGPLTQAQMQELQASENLAKSLRTQAAAAGQAAQQARVTADASKQLGTEMDGASAQIVNAKNQLLAFVGVQGFAQTAQEVGKLADQWVNLQARLKLALGPQTDINKAMADVEAVAKRTYTSLDATASLYGKIATAGKAMGVSQQQALALTESINQSIQLSGASAQASDAAVAQFIQGLQSGVIRGDEFNSIMEQAPRLSQAMADGLKVPIGALRGLAEEGQLTSAKIIRALQTQTEVLNKEFGSLPITIGRSVQNLQTEWLKFVGTLDQTTGASSSVAAGITSIANHLDDLARIATFTGAALVGTFAVQAAAAMRTAAAEMAATGGAAAVLRTNLDKLSRPVQITIAVVGFELGYQLGEMLRENSVLARQLGVGVAEFFTQIVNDLQLVKEAGAAIFTKDTISTALGRYVKRNIEIGNAYRGMYADAEKAPAKIGAAADNATEKVGVMGATATAAGTAAAGAGATGATGIANIGKATDEARLALSALATAVNTKPPADNGLADIVRELQNAKMRGEDLDALLRKNMPEAISKLNGPELVKFRAEFILAMDAAKKALEEAIKTDKPQAEIDALRAKVASFEQGTRTGLALIAEQAAKNLGVDVPLAFNKVSEAFTKSQGDLSVLVRSLPELKAVGVDTAVVVGRAINQMIDGAKNQAELDAIRGRIEALRAELGTKVTDGLLTQLADKADALADMLDKLVPGFQSVEEAMKDLGLTSDYTLGVMADKAEKAYETIKNSGTASAKEIGQAFAAYAEKAIAANNGVATAAIKAEAALHGYKVEVDDTGKNTLKLVTATDGLAASFAKAGEAAKAKAAAMKADNDLALSGLNLRKAEIDSAIAVAQAQGKESEVVRLKIEQKKIEIAIIQATVKAQIDEAQSSISVAEAKMSELKASGSLTAEKKAELEAEIKSAQAKINNARARGESVRVLEQEIKGLQGSTSGYNANTSSINQTTAALEALNAEKEREIAAQKKANELKQEEIDLYNQKWKMDADHNSVDANGKKIEAVGQTQQSLYNAAKDAGLTADQAKQLADKHAPQQGGPLFDNNAFWEAVNAQKQANDIAAAQAEKDAKARAEQQARQEEQDKRAKAAIDARNARLQVSQRSVDPAPTPAPAPISTQAPEPTKDTTTASTAYGTELQKKLAEMRQEFDAKAAALELAIAQRKQDLAAQQTRTRTSTMAPDIAASQKMEAIIAGELAAMEAQQKLDQARYESQVLAEEQAAAKKGKLTETALTAMEAARLRAVAAVTEAENALRAAVAQAQATAASAQATWDKAQQQQANANTAKPTTYVSNYTLPSFGKATARFDSVDEQQQMQAMINTLLQAAGVAA